jgi:transposase
MFHLHNSLNYYLYPLPVDMRKSFYTLSGIITSSMNQNVRDGGVFIFMNRNQNVMKILHMEYAGLVIYHKKLESGRFKHKFDNHLLARFNDHGAKCKNRLWKTSENC